MEHLMVIKYIYFKSVFKKFSYFEAHVKYAFLARDDQVFTSIIHYNDYECMLLE